MIKKTLKYGLALVIGTVLSIAGQLASLAHQVDAPGMRFIETLTGYELHIIGDIVQVEQAYPIIQQLAKMQQDKPLVTYLYTDGGSADTGRIIATIISKHPLSTSVVYSASSAGSIIMAAHTHTEVPLETATIIVHQGYFMGEMGAKLRTGAEVCRHMIGADSDCPAIVDSLRESGIRSDLSLLEPLMTESQKRAYLDGRDVLLTPAQVRR